VAEEGADGCDPSRNRCRRETGRAEFREVLLELLRGDLADGPVEPDRQRFEITPVRVDRLRRPPRREQREEAFDLGIDWWCLHGCRFGAGGESPPAERFRGRGELSRSRPFSHRFPALNSETMPHGTPV
jgi:hypothetical protein